MKKFFGGAGMALLAICSLHAQNSRNGVGDRVSAAYASDTKSDSTLTDPATGLMWARKDNGTDVNWRQSSSYCADLHLEGYSNWRLPTIEEIAAMYDGGEVSKCGEGECFIKWGITLSSNTAWSSSAGTTSSEAWAFAFSQGARASLIRIVSISKRALCVRGSGK
jgi:hypothetical protein